MFCNRCGNKDDNYFYLGSKGYYCRKCIKFSRILLEEDLQSFDYDINDNSSEYHFDYQLTPEQLKASKMTLECIKYSDVLLYCICGAGKSEIVVASISYFLSKGLKVAYAISRREVVIELEKRFKNIFKQARVVSVYGGHHDILTGDLIVCTCHQLYRYYQTFDLLILDEVDAFPLKGNETLLNIAMNACKGRIIFSTATVDDNLNRVLNRRIYKKVELYIRPSYKPLVVPKIININKILSYLYLYHLLKKMDRKCIIFVETKKDCLNLYRLFKKILNCTYVYADLDARDENIKGFRDNKYQFIFSTSVLERGITIKNINVVICNYGSIFDTSNMVQMLGRIGRGVGNYEGDAYIISNKNNENIKETLSYIRKANSYL